MRAVAVYAKTILFSAVPQSGPLAVHPDFPVTKHGPVTLAAQILRLFEGNYFAACQPQRISVGGIMTIEAPAVKVLKLYIIMK